MSTKCSQHVSRLLQQDPTLKILVVSHNPFSTFNNMGKTIFSFFSDFEPSQLCQLYIYPTVPDVRHCNSYYRITDKEVLFSLVGGRTLGGEIFPTNCVAENTSQLYENSFDEKVYSNKLISGSLGRFFRDLIWRYAGNLNDEFNVWMEREKPTHIFAALGNGAFLYDIVAKISSKYKLPIIAYYADDYYFINTNMVDSISRKRAMTIRNKITEINKQSAMIIVICDELMELYAKQFGKYTISLMTGASFEVRKCVKEFCSNPPTINYFGNLFLSRYKPLMEIGQELAYINERYGLNCELNVYTSVHDKSVISQLKQIPTIRLHGFITGKEFVNTFNDSDILVHVENFDPETIDLVRYSVSTKIADSLASGICVFAYGPDNVASISHVSKNNCAIVANSQEQLAEKLWLAISSAEARKACAYQGLKVAEKRHNSERNSRFLRNKFLELGQNANILETEEDCESI